MDENNKALEDAANAMNEAAEAPVEANTDDVKVKETPAEAPAEDAAAEMTEEPKIEEPVETPAETIAPAEPVIEPAAEVVAEPAAEATPAIESAPVIESTATAPAPVAPTAPKKKKTGLIVGIAAGVLVAGAASGFGIAYAISNTKENIALSAISDFLSAKERAINGYAEFAIKEDSSKQTYSFVAESKQVNRVRVDVKTDQDKNNNSNTSVTFTVTYGEKDFKIILNSVILKDYTIYISVENLKETIKDALTEAEDTVYSEYAELYEDLIDTVAGEIEGTWWKINIPDVVDSVSELSSSDKKIVKGIYQCAVDVADRAFAKQDKYADIYKKNAFISLEEYKGSEKPSAKGTPYVVKLDASKLTTFANTVSQDVIDAEYDNCMKEVVPSYTGSSEVTEIKESDVEKALKDFPEVIVTIDNSLFSHTVTGIYYAADEKQYSGKIDLKFSKDVKPVSAPSDTKDISDLYNNVKEAYEEWQETATCKLMKSQYPTYYTNYCDPKTNKLRPEYQSQFNRNLDLDFFEI